LYGKLKALDITPENIRRTDKIVFQYGKQTAYASSTAKRVLEHLRFSKECAAFDEETIHILSLFLTDFVGQSLETIWEDEIVGRLFVDGSMGWDMPEVEEQRKCSEYVINGLKMKKTLKHRRYHIF